MNIWMGVTDIIPQILSRFDLTKQCQHSIVLIWQQYLTILNILTLGTYKGHTAADGLFAFSLSE